MTSPISQDSFNKQQWLVDLANAIQLREGVEGVTKALWILYQDKAFSTRNWSKSIHIPVPVLAALRGELEKINFLESGNKIAVTEEGRKILRYIFGDQTCPEMQCSSCNGLSRILPPEAYPVLEEFRQIAARRPEVDVTLDQSHATPETAIRKALLLLEKGLLSNPLFFLGDDDSISLACLLVRRCFLGKNTETGKMIVADIDRRYLDFISLESGGEIETIEYDVRNELPEKLKKSCRIALTDPAYTENGITLFAYRCLEAVAEKGTLFLSMPIPSPKILRNIQLNILQQGWSIEEIWPRFNEYHGASIHAHVSSLFICNKEEGIAPENSCALRYTSIYTGEIRSPGGEYECTLCGSICLVGPQEEFKTIQDLKKEGCLECQNHSFNRIGSNKQD